MFVSSRRALAKWDRVGEIVKGFWCRREPLAVGAGGQGAAGQGAAVPSHGRRLAGTWCRCLGEFYPVPGSRDGSAGVQACTCRKDCVGCRWRPWPVLWLLSGFFPIRLGLGFGFSLSPSQLLLFICFSLLAPSRHPLVG